MSLQLAQGKTQRLHQVYIHRHLLCCIANITFHVIAVGAGQDATYASVGTKRNTGTTTSKSKTPTLNTEPSGNYLNLKDYL